MDANDETLNKKLQQYKRAIDEEFKLAESPSPDNLAAIKEHAATAFLKAVPSAVQRILYLMDHAEKDTTQLSAAKYVVSAALQKEGIGEAGDPLTQLLKELNAKPPITETEDNSA